MPKDLLWIQASQIQDPAQRSLAIFQDVPVLWLMKKKLHAGKEDLPPPYPLPKNAARKKACCSKPCSKVKLPQGSQHVWSRAGRVRGLARSRSKFKLVWHQFSTVQLSIHHFVWKIHLFSSGHRGQVSPFSSFSSVQFSSRTVSALTRIDLAGSVRLRLGLVHRVSNWLGGAKEQL